MPGQIKKRNGELDFWKFIAAICVALYHSHPIFGKKLFPLPCAMAVEFFFIVSGYLFARSIYKDNRPYDRNTIGSETLSFIIHKIKGFFKLWVFGFLLTYLLKLIIGKIGDPLSLASISQTVSDFLLLRSYGFKTLNVVTASWYLSAMLLVMFVLYPIFRKNKDLFSHVIAPLTGIFILGYIFRQTGNVFSDVDTTLVTNSVLRAFAEISLGVFAYVLADLLSQKRQTKTMGILLSAADVLSILCAFTMMFFMKSSAQPLLILLFFVFVVISGSGQAFVTDLFSNRVSAYLGKLSLSVYLTHCAARAVMMMLIGRFPWFKDICRIHTPKRILLTIAAYLGITLILALCGQTLTDKISSALDRKKAKQTTEK